MKRAMLTLVFLHVLASVASCSPVVGGIPQKAKDAWLPKGDRVAVKAWVEHLDIPWSLVFLPDGRALVSERPGKIRLIVKGKTAPKPYAALAVEHTGEAGLMGLAVHPDFPREPYVYAMHTYRHEGELYNRVVRLKDNGDTGTVDKAIIDRIPGGRLHSGGRIAFGPDRMLYIPTGDTFDSDLAQDRTSLAGKILRVTAEGKAPADNPFRDSPVYSYGHRNPQGLAWEPSSGRMYESEHGPSGEFARFGHDEINIISKGGNYGWPKVIGASSKGLFIDPVAVFEAATPPSGISFYRGGLMKHLRGDLFVATLRSETLLRIRLDPATGAVSRIERWFARESGSGLFGRLRDVVEGPDGALYFLTNNRDGRGTPRSGDDKVYRIVPE